jgi:hypothetical protein
MGEWVQHELNGYPPDAELPAYRIVVGRARGHFQGPFGSGLRYAVLPSRNLPAKYQNWARKVFLRQPIATLDDTARGTDEILHSPWPADLVALVADRFYVGMVLVQAWLEFGRGELLSAVESVRNRILSFALEAEAHVAIDDTPPSPAASNALQQVFHTHIHGAVSNLAQGSSQFAQHSGLAPGDLRHLIECVEGLGLPAEDVRALETAVTEDGPPNGGKVGARVAQWLGSMVSRAIAGAGTVTVNTATEVLPKLIERYYGTAS